MWPSPPYRAASAKCNRPGRPAAGVNMLAMCCWVEGDRGIMLTVPDDCDKACEAVKDSVDSCQCDEVVWLKLANEPGALSEPAKKLTDAGIDVKFLYATTGEAAEATIVLSTDNDAKAAEILMTPGP